MVSLVRKALDHLPNTPSYSLLCPRYVLFASQQQKHVLNNYRTKEVMVSPLLFYRIPQTILQ